MSYVTFGEEGYIDFGKRTTRESFKVEAEEKLIQRVGNDTPVIDYMDESLNASGISASTTIDATTVHRDARPRVHFFFQEEIEFRG